jgi:hypothetical protein
MLSREPSDQAHDDYKIAIGDYPTLLLSVMLNPFRNKKAYDPMKIWI